MLFEPFNYETGDIKVNAIRVSWTTLSRKTICFSISTIRVVKIEQPDGGS